MTEIRDWKKAAARLLQDEEVMKKYLRPTPESIMIEWRNGVYIAQLQVIIPEFSPEIVVLSKPSHTMKRELVDAIYEMQPDRTTIQAEDVLDLEGSTHVVRRLENRLTVMTEEQTQYTTGNMPDVRVVN